MAIHPRGNVRLCSAPRVLLTHLPEILTDNPDWQCGCRIAERRDRFFHLTGSTADQVVTFHLWSVFLFYISTCVYKLVFQCVWLVISRSHHQQVSSPTTISDELDWDSSNVAPGVSNHCSVCCSACLFSAINFALRDELVQRICRQGSTLGYVGKLSNAS